MAHLRSLVQTCNTPGCSARASEALYSFRNELFSVHCAKHARMLAERQAAEDRYHAEAAAEPTLPGGAP